MAKPRPPGVLPVYVRHVDELYPTYVCEWHVKEPLTTLLDLIRDYGIRHPGKEQTDMSTAALRPALVVTVTEPAHIEITYDRD